MPASAGLPVIDLIGGGVAMKLRHACETAGFFYVANHGVEAELTTAIRACAKAFFALPAEAKLAVHFDKSGKQRGYIPLLAESTDPDAAGDHKEALDFTFPIPPQAVSDAVARRMYGDNLWPKELPELRNTVETYFNAMIGLGRSLFSLIAESFGLPHDYFDDKTDRPIAQLRLLRYPPQQDGVGIGAHCDYECLTVLDPGEVGGLQIERDGTWRDVELIPGTFIVNLGEMLSRWTNDLFRATPHRVVNNADLERFTIPFFFGTNYDAWIECLPPCCGPDRPPRYPPILAGEYLAKRLNEVYGAASD